MLSMYVCVCVCLCRGGERGCWGVDWVNLVVAKGWGEGPLGGV